MYKLGFEEAEDLEVKLSTFIGPWKKRQNSRKKIKIYIWLIDKAKTFYSVDHNKPWKILRDGNTKS